MIATWDTTAQTMTYDQFLAKNPLFFNSVTGYAWDNNKASWERTSLSTILTDALEQWYGNRHIADDDNFARFFARKLNMCSLRYARLERLELSEFDPLVSDYVERLNKHTGGTTQHDATTGSGTGHTDDIGTSDSTRTPEITTADNTVTHKGITDTTISTHDPDGYHVKGNTTFTAGTGSTTDVTTTPGVTTKDTTESKAVGKTGPMSASYAEAVAGQVPALDWHALSNQAQDIASKTTTHTGNDMSHTYVSNKGDDVTTTDTYYTGSDKTTDTTQHTGEDVVNNTVATTGKETTTGKTTGTSNSTTSRSESHDGTTSDTYTDKDISSGRGGLTPQAALASAAAYIKDSATFVWLKQELDDCFLSVHDV